MDEEEALMTQRDKRRYVHEGKYVAEVEVSLIEDETR